MTKTQTTKTPATTKAPGSGNCLCGCGELVQTMGRSLYRPGHDARHAGNLGRLAAETGDDSVLDVLPTPALKAKAAAVANNARAKAQARADREAAKANKPAKATKWTYGEAKKGRWTYPTRTNGKVTEINSSRDGSGDWSAL